MDIQKKFRGAEQIIQEKQTDLQNAKGSYMDTQKKSKEKIKQLKVRWQLVLKIFQNHYTRSSSQNSCFLISFQIESCLTH